MRMAFHPVTLTAAAALALLAPEPILAQGQPLPLPPGGFKPPPTAPLNPYHPVAETPPPPFNDQSFVAFRKQLGDIAARKDRAALAAFVTPNFFWMQDKNLADKTKPGIDNLAKAIDLDAKDGDGWDTIAGFANEPTAGELPDQKGVLCAPAEPVIDSKAFEALGEATQTDPAEWGYPTKDGAEVHGAAQLNSPVIEKLGLFLVRVLPDSTPPAAPGAPAFLHVATPSGKVGFVVAETIMPLSGDEICYTKDASGWKIAGYFGGVSP
jgi:hypothetical protein